MIQAFIIVLREGFEAFLIVAIIASYLKKTGRESLIPSVRWGIVVSLFLSVVLGFVLSRGVNEPLWEGVLGLVAAVLVITLVIHMWKHAKFLKSEMESKMATLVAQPTNAAKWSVFLFTTVMIAREGMETALMLIQVPQQHIFLGASLGLLATAIYSVAWVKLSRYLDLKLFFQVTGVFLVLFAIQILIYSAHEFAEAGIFPGLQAFHDASEPYAPDGRYGKWFSVFTVAVTLGWLLIGWAKSRAVRVK